MIDFEPVVDEEHADVRDQGGRDAAHERVGDRGLVTAVLLSITGAHAHHSFTATYGEGATVTIEGALVQFMFRNPHAWVHVMAPDQNGVMQRWGVEWGGAGVLTGQGVTRESLKPGDHVVITGNPGRNPADHRIRMRTLLRPSDGFGWGFSGQTFD